MSKITVTVKIYSVVLSRPLLIMDGSRKLAYRTNPDDDVDGHICGLEGS